MVTPTYRPGVDWSAGHMAQLTKRVSAWGQRQGYRLPYVWVAELTAAGVVHFHLLVWVPVRLMLPCADRQGWWPHGMTNVLPVKHAIGYAAKYASKLQQKVGQFPRGLRLHGAGGLDLARRRVRSWMMLPAWAKSQFVRGEGIRRVSGGFLSLVTGALVASPYFVFAHGAKWEWIVFALKEC